jgi:hypothetical protein
MLTDFLIFGLNLYSQSLVKKCEGVEKTTKILQVVYDETDCEFSQFIEKHVATYDIQNITSLAKARNELELISRYDGEIRKFFAKIHHMIVDLNKFYHESLPLIEINDDGAMFPQSMVEKGLAIKEQYYDLHYQLMDYLLEINKLYSNPIKHAVFRLQDVLTSLLYKVTK